MYPHTLPTWVELWRHRTAVALPLSEPRGKEDPSPSMCLNAWTEPAANFNHGIRNRQLTLVIAGQESNPKIWWKLSLYSFQHHFGWSNVIPLSQRFLWAWTGARSGIGSPGVSGLKPRSLFDMFLLMELKNLNGQHAPVPSENDKNQTPPLDVSIWKGQEMQSSRPGEFPLPVLARSLSLGEMVSSQRLDLKQRALDEELAKPAPSSSMWHGFQHLSSLCLQPIYVQARA